MRDGCYRLIGVVGEGKGFFFGKKKQKTFEPLVGRVRGWALVYGEAKELMKFFWFFLFTKRTTWLGF